MEPTAKEFFQQDGSTGSSEKNVISSGSLGAANVFYDNFNNNSNAESVITGESSPQDDLPRKKLRVAAISQKGNIEATLEGKTLWDEFCRRGTEMIVNRAGRYVDIFGK